MTALIRLAIETYRSNGIKVVLMRIVSFFIVKLKRVIRMKSRRVNALRWAELQGKYEGETLFLLGNGPSLNKTPLYWLKDQYTMCFNRFTVIGERINWTPNFYCVTDDLVIQDMHQEINEKVLGQVDYAFFPDIHPSNVEFNALIDSKDNVYWLEVDKPGFHDRLPQCGINKTVANAGIQIGIFLGFKRIVLLGIDVDFGNHSVIKLNSRNWVSNEHDTNHFDPQYFGHGRKFHDPTTSLMIEKFGEARVFAESHGVEIVNGSDFGQLHVFERKSLATLLPFSFQEQEELFNACTALKRKGLVLSDLKAQAVLLTHPAETPVKPPVLKIEVNQFEKIPTWILIHYHVLGPISGNLYAVSR